MNWNNYGEVDGQISLFDYNKKELTIDKKLKIFEFFGGIGSQSMALKKLGVDFETELVEFDKYPVASYNAIHGTDFKPRDIKDIKGIDLNITEKDKYCYMLFYSFPCQSISIAGKGKGFNKENQKNEETATRSGLLWEVERILNECDELRHKDIRYGMPDILLMENVSNIHSKKFMPDFQEWLNYLESKGYTNFWKDLNTKNFGIAQNRNRTFCVSVRGDYTFEFPNKIDLDTRMKDYLEDDVDEKYYITSDKAQTLVETLILNGSLDFDLQHTSAPGINMVDNINEGGEIQIN